MNLKEATAELHSKAEKMEFNQRMFRGELNNGEYLRYLQNMFHIFVALETRGLPYKKLSRIHNFVTDINELNGNESIGVLADAVKPTIDYFQYLNNLHPEQVKPHIYLNYLALAYGGQMMKSKVPGSGTIYDFEDMQEAVGSIRAIQKDEWADEVNAGFTHIINILDELQKQSEQPSI
jgi:heme oxygenase